MFEGAFSIVAIYMGVPVVVSILPWLATTVLPWDWRRKVLSFFLLATFVQDDWTVDIPRHHVDIWARSSGGWA